MHRSIVLALLFALASTLLLVGTARAAQCEDCDPGPGPGDPGTPPLAVTLSVGVGPTYGRALHAVVATDKPAMDGTVSIAWERAGLPDVVVASGDEGVLDIPTAPRFVPGQTYYLRAHAAKEDGSTGASNRVAFTVSPIADRVEFVGTTTTAPGTIKVTVVADLRTDISPTGTVTLTTSGVFRGAMPLDARGVASFPGFAPGAHDAVATYAGDGIYSSGSAAATITVWRMPASFTTALSSTSLTAGDPVSLHVTPQGGSADHPVAGPWHLWATPVAGGVAESVDGGSTTGDPFDIDLTEWARTHVGSWRLAFAYDGNVWVDAVRDVAVGDLTVAARVVTPPPGPGGSGGSGTPGGSGGPTTTQQRTAAGIAGTVRRAGRKVTLTLTVTGATTPTGTVQIRDGKRLVRTVTLSGGRAVVRLKALKRGRHVLSATYAGSATLLGAQRRWTVRVR